MSFLASAALAGRRGGDLSPGLRARRERPEPLHASNENLSNSLRGKSKDLRNLRLLVDPPPSLRVAQLDHFPLTIPQAFEDLAKSSSVERQCEVGIRPRDNLLRDTVGSAPSNGTAYVLHQAFVVTNVETSPVNRELGHAQLGKGVRLPVFSRIDPHEAQSVKLPDQLGEVL